MNSTNPDHQIPVRPLQETRWYSFSMINTQLGLPTSCLGGKKKFPLQYFGIDNFTILVRDVLWTEEDVCH